MSKKTTAMTAEDAVKKTKKQIVSIVVIGFIFIAADLVVSQDEGVVVENTYGQLYLIRPEADDDNEYLSLYAEIEGKNGIYSKKINVMLEPYGDNYNSKEAEKEENNEIVMTEEEKFDYSIRSIANTLNEDKTIKKVELPDKLESGETVRWQVEDSSKSNTFIIIIMTVFVSLLLYKERYSAIKKQETENRASISKHLPGFINRLVLLINAGMVLSGAFEKAVEESITDDSKEDDYFYFNLKKIYASVKTANGSLNNELKAFARKSGVQELMRVSNIINDNINKGTELTGKLQGECELLWLARKKKCEELGRLAETKLTLPLVMFLIVLIVITISPALLEL